MTSSPDASEFEQAAIRAFLLGADDECVTQWEAAHRAALEAGDPRRARELGVRAADFGHRFEDEDLHAFGMLCHGQALIALGEPDAGVAKLDEVMEAVTTGELNSIATGSVDSVDDHSKAARAR